MMKQEEFKNFKDELTIAVEKNGFLEQSVLRKADLTKQQLEDIFRWLKTKKVDILQDYEVFLRFLPPNDSRIDYCYFIFICKLFNDDIKSENFIPERVRRCKAAIDHFIEYVCSDNEKVFLRTKFGLDNGELLLNNEKLYKKLKYHSLNAFLEMSEEVDTKLIRGCIDESEYLRFQISEIERQYYLADYSCENTTINKEDEAVMFQPLKKENGRFLGYTGPFAISFLDEDAKQIGWIDKPGHFTHAMTFYENNWMIRFYNKKKPHSYINYENGRLIFGLYYPDVGEHGKRYIVESGKNVIIEDFNKGNKISEHEIDFKVSANFESMFSFDNFSQDETTLALYGNSKDYVYRTRTKHNGKYLGCRIYRWNGDSEIGQFSDNGWEGATLTHRSYDDAFFYKQYSKGKLVQNSPCVYVQKADFPQRMSLIFYNSEGKKCVFTYEPSDAFVELVYSEFNSDSKDAENVANLSYPFFKKPIIKEIGIDANEDPEEALNKLIGLENVKKQIRRLKAYLHKNSSTEKRLNLNMVFTGNPGTGKTVVARLLGAILYKEHILNSNKFVEVDRSMLVAEYMGQTEKKVRDIVESAMGGTIFIDEAYALYSRWGEEGADYGRNVLDTLVKIMEDYRGKICFIFAGYKNPMNKMMEMNPGFKSRVNRFIDFPNYSLDELKLITEKMATDNQYVLDQGVANEIISIVKTHLEDDDFANARDVRNILETLYEIQAERTYDERENMVINLEDIDVYKHDINFKSENDRFAESIDIKSLLQFQNTNQPISINNRFIQEASVNIKIFKNDTLTSEGSGFFISPDGFIGTCAHVVEDAEDIKVNVNLFTDTGKRVSKLYKAKTVGLDKESDVAIIKLVEPDIEFSSYILLKPETKYSLVAPIAMGGYPLGGERFKTISINEGKIQAFNKDSRMDEEQRKIDRIYVDLTGHSGNSGSGVVLAKTNECIGVFAGSSVKYIGYISQLMNYAIPVKYLWNLIYKLTEEVTDNGAPIVKNKQARKKKAMINENDFNWEKMEIGAKTYAQIMKIFNEKRDISNDREFQRRFTGFYKIRRDRELFLNHYYSYMQKIRNDENITFEQILKDIYSFQKHFEPSFSSKLLATLNPNMPVWDKYVLQNMGIDIKKYSLQNCINGYKKIIQYYNEKESTGEADELINLFDSHFPQFKYFTRIKKMDLMFWQKR